MREGEHSSRCDINSMITIIDKPDTMSMDRYAQMMRLADDWRVKYILNLQKNTRDWMQAGFNPGAQTEDKEMTHAGRIPYFLTKTAWYRERFPHDMPPDDAYKQRDKFFKSNSDFRSSYWKL